MLDTTYSPLSTQNQRNEGESYSPKFQRSIATPSSSTSSSTGAGYTERDYQISAMEKLRNGIRAGMRRQVLVAPTGSGKTVTAAGIVRRAVAKGSRIHFLAHRRELIEQCSEKLAENEIDHGVIMGNHWRRAESLPVQVASVQTLIRRMHHLDANRPDLIIVDECHRSTASTYRHIIDACPNAALIGLTATPERADGTGLGEIYDGMVQTTSVSELINRGFLVPPRVFAPANPDLSGVHSRRGDYDQSELANAVDKPDLVGDVLRHWQEHASDRPTVVFAVNVEHSLHLRDMFRSAGVPAEHVDGKTSDKERPAILGRWKSGETQVVTNCEVLTEGFDFPQMSAVVLCRPTRSLGLYLQMVGRGLRPWPGKKDCIVLDHAGAAYNPEFGLPHEDREWTLDGRAKRVKQNGSSVTVCPSCFSAFPSRASRKCPYCGWQIPVSPREIDHVDGTLEEITLDHVKRMRKKGRAKAKTLEELEEFGRQQGYKPAWAKYVWEARQRRRGGSYG